MVRDDVLLLAEGDRVPADGLLLQAHELATDESTLSGESESESVAKQLPDGCVFAGTLVVSGQGMVRVSATGGHTELGRIGQSLQTIALEASPLREEMARLTRRLVVVGVTLCVLLAALFWFLRDDWLASPWPWPTRGCACSVWPRRATPRARTGHKSSTISISSGWAWLAWPTLCGPKCPRPWRNAARPASAW